jgi:glycerol-3-phosphate cytidylyltransferase
MDIIKALSVVDEVFFEESLELKGEYIKKYKADVLVMGDD